jgi:hypothetical protein
MAVLPRVKRTAVTTPPSHTSRQRTSASGTYVKSRAKPQVRTARETISSSSRLTSDCSGPQTSTAAPARAALTTSETRSRKASANTMASEKIRSRSQAQIPAQTPSVGAGWTSQMRFILTSAPVFRPPVHTR